ncbi:hypothetical protein FYK55_19180 [Roseiconus nitratireducens]|uniref:Uncharacterized protein n=1 Tax=Roseiconus nitratireducens TaxID=2605748 RepID=A0A5M6D147_9BACT|nr:hypothetical protein [Roseiconus nitratireducens]KAA5541023.1 hypothetical protein FYK55_19180 [Roseiconus nitratireducens]
MERRRTRDHAGTTDVVHQHVLRREGSPKNRTLVERSGKNTGHAGHVCIEVGKPVAQRRRIEVVRRDRIERQDAGGRARGSPQDRQANQQAADHFFHPFDVDRKGADNEHPRAAAD